MGFSKFLILSPLPCKVICVFPSPSSKRSPASISGTSTPSTSSHLCRDFLSFSLSPAAHLSSSQCIVGHRRCSVCQVHQDVQPGDSSRASTWAAAAAKYARAERELKPARPYGAGAAAFYDKAEVKALEDKPQQVIVACSSDRGLCGAIHSSICKHIKAELAGDASKAAIICVGDKSRAQLQRTLAGSIIAQVGEVGRKPATFEDAGRIMTFILNSGYEFGSGKIVYNKFKTVVSYDTLEMPFYPSDAINAGEKIALYDSLDADVVQSYMEYSLASLMFYTLKEGACSEQSSRMTAMDAASKNAGEMIDKLTLTYNRTRQAVITGELIEIISGAAAV
ncbi:mitochondrial ATP synthase gamma subunit precursor [Penaeus vannamei]|uniref:ATP synthase subunit gamma n=1 Tax=Penaeus vannamei TaxID=6689 RepID=A0A423TUC1_PENVA|nr:mitochondrial ATP synthase gamma subunit precursor [Penaeus vannamei]